MSPALPPTGPRAGLMGHRIGYSRSPLMHRYWLELLGLGGSYELVDISPAEFPAFLSGLHAHGWVGGNITKPHKELAFRLVDRADAAATAIGAVNTVYHEGGRLFGSNTDAHGFVANLDEAARGWDRSDGLAVVLGAGGAARAVVYALRSRGLRVAVCNRTVRRAQALAAEVPGGCTAHPWEQLPGLLERASLLANTTVLGARGEPPLWLELERLPREAVVCDLVYVPLRTELLKAAERRGQRTADGLGMLMHQAVPGFARWFGISPQVTPELRRLLAADIAAEPRCS